MTIIIDDYVYLNQTGSGNYDNLNPYIIGDVKISYGISGNSLTDRIASTGTMKFTLNNASKKFTPGYAGCMPFFKQGTLVWHRMYPDFTGSVYCKFFGRISSIVINAEDNTVDVTVVDWMDIAATFPIVTPTIQTNKRIEEVVASVISMIPSDIRPIATEYNIGQITFPTVFDTVTYRTTAMGEFNKLVLSELSYIYVKRSGTFGEKLVVEDRYTRDGTRTIVKIPSYYITLNTELDFILTTEDGDHLFVEGGQDLHIDSTMTSVELRYGENLINRLGAKVYPRGFDSSPQILFRLNAPLYIADGVPITNLKGTYRDPTGVAQRVNGKDMLAPVSGTDYKMTQNEDGSGANLTASLTVTPVYGTESVIYTLSAVGDSGWITILQAKGTGIYLYDPVEYIAENAASQRAYGYREKTIEMKYQDSVSSAIDTVNVLIAQNLSPRMNMNSISMLANTSEYLTMAFVTADIGDLIVVTDSMTGITGMYYINNVSFTLKQGGLVYFTWGLVEALTIDNSYWILDTSLLDSQTILGY
jgi:hypothetical protein